MAASADALTSLLILEQARSQSFLQVVLDSCTLPLLDSEAAQPVEATALKEKAEKADKSAKAKEPEPAGAVAG